MRHTDFRACKESYVEKPQKRFFFSSRLGPSSPSFLCLYPPSLSIWFSGCILDGSNTIVERYDMSPTTTCTLGGRSRTTRKTRRRGRRKQGTGPSLSLCASHGAFPVPICRLLHKGRVLQAHTQDAHPFPPCVCM